MPEPAVTLRDVAREAGVHPATASRALNPETRLLVSENTASRVLAAAAALGYRPNAVARSLRTRRSHTVGVLIPDLNNPLFPPIVRGLEDRGFQAAMAGARLEVPPGDTWRNIRCELDPMHLVTMSTPAGCCRARLRSIFRVSNHSLKQGSGRDARRARQTLSSTPQRWLRLPPGDRLRASRASPSRPGASLASPLERRE
jgi:Bacterial regulatory proteins, lacI family